MFGDIIHRKKIIALLEEFVYMAEKGTPLSSGFQKFPKGRIGSLLNRIVAVYGKSMNDRSSLHAAHEMVIKESQDNIRQKKQLTQNINHELKTPVSSINGYLETILNNPGLTDEQKMIFLRKCHDQSQRLAKLLSDLSLVTRLDEAMDIIEKEDLSLSSIIREAVEDMTPIANERITIVNKFPDDRRIAGSRTYLYSIFRNLLENAIFYSKGTKVEIELVSEDKDDYHIRVWDDGVGIEGVHLCRIFERFYRVDKGRSRKMGGTGLGLSIVKNAVSLHGGNISASCVSPSGLAFSFNLSKN